jgi:hypothetical protein
MEWDYSFFIPKNNAFSKQWSKPEDEDTSILIVTEVNRCLPCVACQEPVGEVANTFYEIDQTPYCAKCGAKLSNGTGKKEDQKKTVKKPLAATV